MKAIASKGIGKWGKLTMAQQQMIYHGTVSSNSTLSIDLDIVRRCGFDGLEVSATKMRDVLAAGFTEAELATRLKNVAIPGIGFLVDLERTADQEPALMREAEDIMRLAGVAGAKAVQVLTGPVQVQAVEAFAVGAQSNLYHGVLGLPLDEQIRITASNLSRLADMAAEHGLLVYLESLAWTPLNRLADQVELIERAGRDNLRLAVDFWHCYASGDKPEDVARLDGNMIYGVHVCDSRPHSGGIPNEAVLRDVPTGSGVLALRDWADAVKATGYDGWWSCELFCRRQRQDDSYVVARDLHDLMSGLIRGPGI